MREEEKCSIFSPESIYRNMVSSFTLKASFKFQNLCCTCVINDGTNAMMAEFIK